MGANSGQVLTGQNTGNFIRGVMIGQNDHAVAVVANTTAGLVLTANGPNADPTWQGGGGGGVTMPITGTPDVTITATSGIISLGASGDGITLGQNPLIIQGHRSVYIQAAEETAIYGASVFVAATGAGGAATLNASDGAVRISAGGANNVNIGGNAGVNISATTGDIIVAAFGGAATLYASAGITLTAHASNLTMHGNQIFMLSLPTSDPHSSGALWQSGAGHVVVVSQG